MKLIKRPDRIEPLIYGGLLIVVVGSWFFVHVAREVVGGKTRTLDELIVRSMRQVDDPAQPIGPPWMSEIGRDLTALGGYTVILLVLAAVSGFLWLDGRHRMTGLVWAAVVSGFLLAMGLKSIFHRPRPDIVPHLSYVDTTSFPSGHSMMSAVVYLTLGTLLARVANRRRLKIYFLVIPLIMSALVGASRVYMGVHYPSDVLAGWSAGLAWATLCWLTVVWLERRGVIVEPLEATSEPPLEE